MAQDPPVAPPDPSSDADVEFYFDPVCPFAWITSRWVERVAARRHYAVSWRFIALRIINEDQDYERDFPPGYEQGHTAGLRLLRVAAAVRPEHGDDGVGRFYAAVGSSIHDAAPDVDRSTFGTVEHAAASLAAADLPVELAAAVDDDRHDDVVRAESNRALERTGRDVGTPIITFRPPDGPSFFGPVISRVPDDDEAVALWESVIHLATFPGFAELKRSLRERPQLRSLGADVDVTPVLEDWQGGHRRDA